jgi:hypothetical protein
VPQSNLATLAANFLAPFLRDSFSLQGWSLLIFKLQFLEKNVIIDVRAVQKEKERKRKEPKHGLCSCPMSSGHL